MTRVFDLVTIGGIDTITSGIEMFAKSDEASCTAPATSKDQEKHLENSLGKAFAEFDNGQKCLTDWQKKGES